MTAGPQARPARSPKPARPGEAEGDWLRLSPRSLIVRPLTDLVRLLPLVAGLLILHSRAGDGLIWGMLAAVAAIVSGLVALVPRARKVKVECLDAQGQPRVIRASGWYARSGTTFGWRRLIRRRTSRAHSAWTSAYGRLAGRIILTA